MSDVATRVESILARYRPAIIAAMQAEVARAQADFAPLVSYHLGWTDAAGNPAAKGGGGKLLRPALCLLVAEALGASRKTAMPAAVALELVHNFTLIHDDIEDASDTRHGDPALWRVVGTPLALNAGDGLFVVARRALLRLRETGVSADGVLHAVRVLDDACVALCAGQHADISFEQRDAVTLVEYEAMVAGKTAALLGASMALGAIGADASSEVVDAFGECGRLLGMAFQVQDDVLGVWGEADVTGKPVAQDVRSRKKSFPLVWAREHADGRMRARLLELHASAPDDAVVAKVVSLLDQSGAREAASASARSYAERALSRMAMIDMVGERRTDIEAVAAFFVERSS